MGGFFMELNCVLLGPVPLKRHWPVTLVAKFVRLKAVAEVAFADEFVFDDLSGRAFCEDGAFEDDVNAVAKFENAAFVVIGDERGDAFIVA